MDTILVPDVSKQTFSGCVLYFFGPIQVFLFSGLMLQALTTSFPAQSSSPLSQDQPSGLQSSLASGGPWAELGRVGERPLASFDKMATRIRCDFLGALKVSVVHGILVCSK